MCRLARHGRDRAGFALFGEPGVLLLLALSDGPKHGGAITAGVVDRTGIQLGRGRNTARWPKLEDLGLISALPSENRRRPYEINEITSSGRSACVRNPKGGLVS